MQPINPLQPRNRCSVLHLLVIVSFIVPRVYFVFSNKKQIGSNTYFMRTSLWCALGFCIGCWWDPCVGRPKMGYWMISTFNVQTETGGGGSSWLAAQPCGSSQPLSSMIFLYLVAEGRILDREMSTEWVRVRNCNGPIQSDCPECAIYLLVL